MKMFLFGDIAVRLYCINYIHRGIDNLSFEKRPYIEVGLKGEARPIHVNCKDIAERDAIYKVLIDQIEDEDK